MADLEEVSLLTCSRCERPVSGTAPRKGASLCEKPPCDQWVMKAGFLSRLLKALRG